MRGVYQASLPSISAPISAAEPFLATDWRIAQQATDRPVKMTVPGPMTIADSTIDRFYGDRVKLGMALAQALKLGPSPQRAAPTSRSTNPSSRVCRRRNRPRRRQPQRLLRGRTTGRNPYRTRLLGLPLFRDSTIVFGVIAIAKSDVESVAALQRRIAEALRYVDADRFVIAPDCGLGFLGRDLAILKLRNMTAAARAFAGAG